MIKQICDGLFGSSVYVVYTEESKRAIVIDCGAPIRSITDFVRQEGLLVDYIVLTHGHIDHVFHIDKYIATFRDAKILCHVDELKVLLDPEANLTRSWDPLWTYTPRAYDFPYVTVNDGDIISIGENDKISFKIIHTPGHTPGSICLLDEEGKLMITGDTLFKDGYGAYGFKYGNRVAMQASLARLLSLDPEITFYPGHGEESKLKYEKGLQYLI